MRALLILALLAAYPAAAETLTGEARVIDGDTIEVAGERIRLHGIDAPESRQACMSERGLYGCGREATAAMQRAIGGQPVECKARDVDRYGRLVAVCFNDDGEDIGEALLLKAGRSLTASSLSTTSTRKPRLENQSAGCGAGRLSPPGTIGVVAGRL